MAGLRRGIMSYADGTDNVPAPTFAPLALGNAAQRGPRSVAPVAITPPPPTTPAAPPTAPLWSQPAPSPAFNQILQGQFEAAQQNPNVSPVQAAAAALGQHIQTAKRAADLVNPPSPSEYLTNLFTGNPQTTAALQQREKTANTLADPLVQQFVTTHPDHLLEAEQNKDAFAAKAQTPEFQQTMQDAVKNHATVARGVPVTNGAGDQRTIALENPTIAARAMGDHGVTAQQAAGLTHPHQMSREEFLNSMRGIPTKIAQIFINAQSAHVLNPQQQVTRDYVQELRAQLESEAKKIMEEQDPNKRSKLIDLYNATTYPNYMKQMGTLARGYEPLPAMGQGVP